LPLISTQTEEVIFSIELGIQIAIFFRSAFGLKPPSFLLRMKF
jgi:hypothetical protein